MKKHRASLMLLTLAIILSGAHFFFGVQNSMADAATHGTEFVWSDFINLWLKETFEAFPAELSALAIELALFAGIFKLFKPYDEDTEHIKQLEERIMERFESLEGNDEGQDS